MYFAAIGVQNLQLWMHKLGEEVVDKSFLTFDQDLKNLQDLQDCFPNPQSPIPVTEPAMP